MQLLNRAVTRDVTSNNNPLTCHVQEHRHRDLGFCVDLALVLPHVPLLGVPDLQGPGVRLLAVQTPEPAVTCEGDDTAGQDVEGGLLYPGHLKEENQCESCSSCPQTLRDCPMNNLWEDNQSGDTRQRLFATSEIEFMIS